MPDWTREKIRSRLAANSWFIRQPTGLQRLILEHGRVVRFGPRQWLHSQGDTSTGLLAVLEGQLRLEMALTGKRSILCGMLGSGAIIGQSISFGGGPRLITAVATDEVTALIVADTGLRKILRATADIWRALAELLYEQLERNVRGRVLALSLPPRARLAATLLDLRQAGGDAGVLHINQTDLAELCGLSRKSVNIHMNALRRQQAVSIGYRCIRILDWDRVSAVAYD